MKKKILYVIGSLERGGTELHLSNILPILKHKYGWEPSIFCLDHSGELSKKFIESDIPVILPPIEDDGLIHNIFYRTIRLSAALIKLWYFMLSTNQKIVHFFLPLSYIIGMPVAVLAGRKHLVMSRRSLNYYQNKIIGIKFIEYTFQYGLSVILGNSKAVMKDLINESMSRNKLRLIYNGVPISEPTENTSAVRKKLNIKKDTVVFIIVANLIAYKGHDILLKAISNIKNEFNKDWCLLIVGEDRGVEAALKKQVIEDGISNNIKWLGAREDIVNLLAASDIGVSSSREEGFSNSILEAMMVGLPMVVTEVGGNSEAIIDGETGFIVPANNVQRMGEALIKLSNDPGLRKIMGRSSRQRVSQYFTLDTCVEKYDLVYKAILNKQSIPCLDI